LTEPELELPTGEALVRHTEQLARVVATGDTARVPDLVRAASALQAACDTAGPGSGYYRRRTGPTGDPAADLRNRVANAGFLVTTAGELRRVFTRRCGPERDIGLWNLYILPTTLPATDTTPVAIYSSRGLTSYLLGEVANEKDTTDTVDRLIGRVVHHHLMPHEEDWLQYRAD
jgi:hypothetical protein